MLRWLVIAAWAIMVVGVAPRAEAQSRSAGDRWILLGTQQVNLRNGTETIDVSDSQGRVKALRLETPARGILLSLVKVTYSDGSVHEESRRINLLTGERTRPMDLSRRERFVDKLELVYEPQRTGRLRSLVEVWGLQSPEGSRARRTDRDRPTAGNISGPSSPPTPTQAQPGEQTSAGVLFGVQQVGFGVDRDTIKVGREIGRFDRIRLRVLDNDIHINELRVVYGRGEPDALAVNANVSQNTFTDWLPLKGSRFIDEIQLSYRSRPSFRGQATVEVYGEYAKGWAGADGEARRYNQGWVLLGAQTADFIGFDRDVIAVGREQGQFRKIRATVRGRAVTMQEIRVVYGNGREEVVSVRKRVDAGSTYGPVDLKGNLRFIDRIELRHRSRVIDSSARGKGRALVEVWGQH